MILQHRQNYLSLQSPSAQYPTYHQPFEYDIPAISSSLDQSSPPSSLSHGWTSPSPNLITPTQSDYDFGNYHKPAASSDYTLPFSEDDQGALDSDPTHRSPDFTNASIHSHIPFSRGGDVELMQSDQAVLSNNWVCSNGQLTPISGRSHHRESSLSSRGSAGPASPFNGPTISQPQVLLPTDTLGENYYEGLHVAADSVQYHQNFSKPLTPSQTPSQESFLAPPYKGFMAAYGPNQRAAAIMALQTNQAPVEDEYNSHPTKPSVANESPAPPAAEGFEDRKPTDFRTLNTIPKLDRTMSDAYNDELYSPGFYIPTSTIKSIEGAPAVSRPQTNIFSQRLQAANRQHLSAASQSPFLERPQDSTCHLHTGSPLAPTFGSINSAKQMREKQKAESDARALEQQMQRSSPQQATPETISPKDAMLEFHETEQDVMIPMCSPHPSDIEETTSQRSFGGMVTGGGRESSSAFSTPSQTTQQQGSPFTFVAPPVPDRLRIPQQYPFVPQQRRPQSGTPSSLGNSVPGFPSSLAMMESNTEYAPEEPELKKPAGCAAEGGTYTCTYHGCTLRFETPAKLQKHKREGHRQAVPVRAGSADGGGMTSAALRDSQAGPHYCKRINPSTGKPCNTAFSRPYDLTRHEDTIHNARKQKVRCQLCTEEKTFSRNDALTRHMRVVHPNVVDFSAKNRRRSHD